MKRLMLGCLMAFVALALTAPVAQASSRLTMNEARLAIAHHGIEKMGGLYYGESVSNCSRLAPDRIRCSVRFRSEYPKPKVCGGRVEVVETTEVVVRTLRMKCKRLEVSYLTFERARRAAARAMDPKAMHPNYSMGYGGGSVGKNRYSIEASWVNGKDQICLQTARVRLVKEKVLVNVSEIACVDEPDWPDS